MDLKQNTEFDVPLLLVCKNVCSLNAATCIFKSTQKLIFLCIFMLLLLCFCGNSTFFVISYFFQDRTHWLDMSIKLKIHFCFVCFMSGSYNVLPYQLGCLTTLSIQYSLYWGLSLQAVNIFVDVYIIDNNIKLTNRHRSIVYLNQFYGILEFFNTFWSVPFHLILFFSLRYSTF